MRRMDDDQPIAGLFRVGIDDRSVEVRHVAGLVADADVGGQRRRNAGNLERGESRRRRARPRTAG